MHIWCMFTRDVNAVLQILFMYKLREVFTTLKIIIMTEASKLMSEDQFDVRKGQNLKMQLNMHFKDPYFAEMINSFGIFIC